MSKQLVTVVRDASSDAAGARSAASVSRAMSLDAATTIAATLRALADPLRLRMLSLIDSSPSGELCVHDLATVAEVSLPTVSHHLRVLKDVGLLAAERRGTFVHYRVPDAARPAVAALLEGLAPAALERPTAPDPEIPAGLADADAALDRIAARLSTEFAGLESDDVKHTVRESYAALHRTSRIPGYVVVLAERFARQRLADRVRSVGDANPRPQVLFVCVANAGRSQLAAALLHHYAGDAIEVRSAGSRPAASVHETVGAVLAQIRSGRGEEPFPKPLTDDAIRASDVIVTMGCGDACPILPGKRYQDWVIPDPALASPEGVSAIVAELDQRVRQLVSELAPALDLPARPALLPAEPSPNTKENP
jgi:ArsR family transcriptional regulator